MARSTPSVQQLCDYSASKTSLPDIIQRSPTTTGKNTLALALLSVAVAFEVGGENMGQIVKAGVGLGGRPPVPDRAQDFLIASPTTERPELRVPSRRSQNITVPLLLHVRNRRGKTI